MTNPLSHAGLISIAEEFGTPLYVYHAEVIKEQYQKLQHAFQQTNTVFFYACKALTNINILRNLFKLVIIIFGRFVLGHADLINE